MLTPRREPACRSTMSALVSYAVISCWGCTSFSPGRWRAKPAAVKAVPPEERYWELSEEDRARLAEEMDTNAPYRYLLLFLAALLVGKALPDAVFSYLRNLAGIRGAVLDPQMLAFDALLCGLGVGLAYAALTLLGPPEIPPPREASFPQEAEEETPEAAKVSRRPGGQ